MIWDDAKFATGKSFTCGYCGTHTSPSEKYSGYNSRMYDRTEIAQIYICSGCSRPTFFIQDNFLQTPGPLLGRDVKHVPDQIKLLYDEARKCYSIDAHTSAVLACRKILMNVAVQEGAPENKKFVEYVDYLGSNGYIPPKGRVWVDRIRTRGNEATHEIQPMDEASAKELITFVEMLLIYTYEFPASVS